MVFNDTSTYLGLCQDANFWCGLDRTDTTTYPTSEKTRNGNAWYRKAVAIIRKASGAWLPDDVNNTDLLINKTDLVVNQDNYSLPAGYGRIERMEVKDSTGDWSLVDIMYLREVPTALEEFNATSGLPTRAIVLGNSYRLNPVSDRTSSDGDSLRVYTTQDIDAFTASDTTQEPGFHQDYHRYISLGMAYDFLCANDKDGNKTDRVKTMLLEYERDLEQHYSSRGELKPTVTSSHRTQNYI